jgi:hypothetical protein
MIKARPDQFGRWNASWLSHRVQTNGSLQRRQSYLAGTTTTVYTGTTIGQDSFNWKTVTLIALQKADSLQQSWLTADSERPPPCAPAHARAREKSLKNFRQVPRLIAITAKGISARSHD